MPDSSKPQQTITAAHTPHDCVRVRGARENNLQNIDLDLPRDAMVVFTGVSGSGKSSLAFGALYAEAQRRYFESVAPYARRLIEQVGVPDVDSIDGLPPAVALQQRRGGSSSRSSVGSLTTLCNALRMLYSRAGTYPHGQELLESDAFSPNTPAGACPACHGLGQVFDASEESMVPDPSLTIRERAIAAWPGGWQGKNYREILMTLGYDVDVPWRELPREQRDWILFTTDEPTVPVFRDVSAEEARTAYARGDAGNYRGTYVSARAYVMHAFSSSQSANIKKRVSRYMVASACSVCDGKRLRREALAVHFSDMDIATASRLSIRELAEHLRPASEAQVTEADEHPEKVKGRCTTCEGEGFVSVGLLFLPSVYAPCPDCRGARYNDATLEVTWHHRNIAQVLDMSVDAAADFFGDDVPALARALATLREVGLGYLRLGQPATELSGGEAQRIKLATELQRQQRGHTLYVLDEPTTGLHPADTDRLMRQLHGLVDAGHSVIVIEHDLRVIADSDWVIDMGPGAGDRGGQLVVQGTPAQVAASGKGVTSTYLARAIPSAS